MADQTPTKGRQGCDVPPSHEGYATWWIDVAFSNGDSTRHVISYVCAQHTHYFDPHVVGDEHIIRYSRVPVPPTDEPFYVVTWGMGGPAYTHVCITEEEVSECRAIYGAWEPTAKRCRSWHWDHTGDCPRSGWVLTVSHFAAVGHDR